MDDDNLPDFEPGVNKNFVSLGDLLRSPLVRAALSPVDVTAKKRRITMLFDRGLLSPSDFDWLIAIHGLKRA